MLYIFNLYKFCIYCIAGIVYSMLIYVVVFQSRRIKQCLNNNWSYELQSFKRYESESVFRKGSYVMMSQSNPILCDYSVIMSFTKPPSNNRCQGPIQWSIWLCSAQAIFPVHQHHAPTTADLKQVSPYHAFSLRKICKLHHDSKLVLSWIVK